MICSEIISSLEALSPKEYAMSWDNVGLLVGHRGQMIKTVLVALDATDEVVEYAVAHQADLLITHHPMIFSSMKRVNDDDFIGRKILKLVENQIACYAMHTNFDIKGGMGKLAEERLMLKQACPLEVTAEDEAGAEGIGRVGELSEAVTLAECAEFVKKQFGLSHVSVFGSVKDKVKRVAISPGSGRSMIEEALKNHAEVLITGDIGHHEGLDAIEQGLSIIDAGHYGLEYIFIDFIKEYLINTCQNTVTVLTYKSGNPYQIM